MQKKCFHCERPLRVYSACRACYGEVDPIKLEYILLTALGILILGFLFGLTF